MPRNPKGELSLSEIRNLARQHNKLQTIKGIDSSTRANLIKQIENLGYVVNHEKKMIKKRSSTPFERSKGKIKVGDKGERKPQKETLKKQEKERIKKTGAEPPKSTGKKPRRPLKGRLTAIADKTDRKKKERERLKEEWDHEKKRSEERQRRNTEFKEREKLKKGGGGWQEWIRSQGIGGTEAMAMAFKARRGDFGEDKRRLAESAGVGIQHHFFT